MGGGCQCAVFVWQFAGVAFVITAKYEERHIAKTNGVRGVIPPGRGRERKE